MTLSRIKVIGLLASLPILATLIYTSGHQRQMGHPMSGDVLSKATHESQRSRELNIKLDDVDQPAPLPANSKLNRAITLIGASSFREAESLLLELLEKNPNDTEVLSELVTVEVGKMNPAKAVQYIETILQVDPNVPGIWTLYQDTVALADEQQAAIAFLKHLPSKERFEVPYSMGLFLGKTGQHAEAIALFEKSLQYDSAETGKIYQQISAMQRRLGDYAAAETSLQSAVDADETSLPSLISLVEVYLESGRFSEARALLDELLETDPANPYLQAYSRGLDI